MLGQNLAVLNRLNQSQSRHLQGDSESQVSSLVFLLEIRLSQGAVWNCGIVCAAAHGPQLMDSAIGRAVRFVLESYFADWPKLMFKTWHGVLSPIAVRDQLNCGFSARRGVLSPGLGTR